MKYKLISFGLAMAVLVSSLLLSAIDLGQNRYHQHQEAVQKEACTYHGDEMFCTHLPLLNITTEEEIPYPYLTDEQGNHIINEFGSSLRNNEMVAAKVQYFDSETENNHLNDVPVIEENAMIRVRGATSRAYDKKGYALKIKKENMTDNQKVSFSGMTKDDDWVLHGPFLDKTLIRNYLCYNLAGEIMDYAPNVRFCEMYLNGEYMGIYLLTEEIGYNKNGRIDVKKTDPDIEETSFIVELDRKPQDSYKEIETFGTYSLINPKIGNENIGFMQIKYPNKTLTEEQRGYIEAYISRFEKALYSYAYTDNDKGYQNYIHVDSFVDYFLINEFTLNYDAVGLSTFLYKDIGDKLKLCVWDFNSAFDYYMYSVSSPETLLLQDSMWYKYLFKDKDFVTQVVNRYEKLRKRLFSEEYLFLYIDETIAYLGPAIERNYEKWGYSFNSVHNGVNIDLLVPEERNVRSYEEAIEQLKESIKLRIEYMDAYMERLRVLSHESMNKMYIYEEEGK